MKELDFDRTAPVFFVEQTDSTNNALKTMAYEGAEHGTVLIAAAQTAGKGRRGRSFISPKGGLYFSALYYPDCAPDRISSVTASAALAACRAVKSVCGAESRIKWPNDLVLNGKKLCGILTEAGVTGERLFVIIGIGINVNTVPEEFSATATSLCTETGRDTDIMELAAALARELDLAYMLWRSDASEELEEYRRLCLNLGREVAVHSAEGERTALAVDIGSDFSLRVRYDDGEEESVRSGEVSVRGLYGYV